MENSAPGSTTEESGGLGRPSGGQRAEPALGPRLVFCSALRTRRSPPLLRRPPPPPHPPALDPSVTPPPPGHPLRLGFSPCPPSTHVEAPLQPPLALHLAGSSSSKHGEFDGKEKYGSGSTGPGVCTCCPAASRLRGAARLQPADGPTAAVMNCVRVCGCRRNSPQ